MSRLTTLIWLLVQLFALQVTAHLIIQYPSPLPFPQEGTKLSPLMSDGSNFPCKYTSPLPLDTANRTDLSAGGTSQLIFSRSITASHGGGSCQLSITYETDLQKMRDPMAWYVIKSIEGGCPTNADGNLAGTLKDSKVNQCTDAGTDGVNCLNQFDFTLPQGVKGGPAVFAWTWFNRIGVREMYMNCAAVDIAGGAQDTSGMQDLPGLTIANLDAPDLPSSCKTVEMQNPIFRDPGPELEHRLPSPHAGGPQVSVPGSTDMVGDCPSVARQGGGAGGGSGSGSGGGQTNEVTTGGSSQGQNPQGSPSVSFGPAAANPQSGSSPASAGGYGGEVSTMAPSSGSDSVPTSAPDPLGGGSMSLILSSFRNKGVVHGEETATVPASMPTPEAYGESSAPAAYGETTTPAAYGGAVTQPAGYAGTGVSSVPAAYGESGTSDLSSPAATSVAGSGSTPGQTSVSGTGSGQSSNSTCAQGSVSCSTPGQVLCISSTQFGLCDIDNCAVPQAVAAGTQCKDGAIGFADGYLPTRRRRRGTEGQRGDEGSEWRRRGEEGRGHGRGREHKAGLLRAKGGHVGLHRHGT